MKPLIYVKKWKKEHPNVNESERVLAEEVTKQFGKQVTAHAFEEVNAFLQKFNFQSNNCPRCNNAMIDIIIPPMNIKGRYCSHDNVVLPV